MAAAVQTFFSRNRIKTVTFLFLVFSFLYIFITSTKSYWYLGNDTSHIGVQALSKHYTEIFKNDPVFTGPSFYYIPLYLSLVRGLESLTSDYLISLQIILFLQIFLGLFASYLLLKRLLPDSNVLIHAVLSWLITMIYIKLPFGESCGFMGISSVIPRNVFGILISRD